MPPAAEENARGQRHVVAAHGGRERELRRRPGERARHPRHGIVSSVQYLRRARLVPDLIRLARLVVLVATLPFVTAGALPAWAELLGAEQPHVCHCSRDHHGCVCVRCHTDPDAEMGVSSDSMKGRCGDDDAVAGGAHVKITVLRPMIGLAPAPLEGRASIPRLVAPRSRDRAPPTPPPPRMLG